VVQTAPPDNGRHPTRYIRDLVGVLDREKAIVIFINLQGEG
jgi:hypothetical protein